MSAEARIAFLEKALLAIVSGDVPRPIGERYRKDNQPSKHDTCVHDMYMYEDCSGCYAMAAANALKEAPKC